MATKVTQNTQQNTKLTKEQAPLDATVTINVSFLQDGDNKRYSMANAIIFSFVFDSSESDSLTDKYSNKPSIAAFEVLPRLVESVGLSSSQLLTLSRENKKKFTDIYGDVVHTVRSHNIKHVS
jgi:hypothetical protein